MRRTPAGARGLAQGHQLDQQPDHGMKVLLIHHTIDPNMAPVLARLAATPGITLEVLFASRLPPHRQWPGQLDDNFRYKVLPRLQVNLGLPGAPLVLRANPTVVKEIVHSRPDVVISTPFPSLTSLSALLLCRLLRTPFILDIYTMRNASLGRRLLSPFLRGIISCCAGFVAKSTRTIEYLTSLGVPRDCIFLSYQAVDGAALWERSRLLQVEQQQLKRAYQIKPGKMVLYVGRLVKRKGLSILLQAFKQLQTACPDTSLVLVGDGYQRPALEELCSTQAISNVHFLGALAHGELPRFYGLADLFVLPSISTRFQFWGEEAWGFVVAEAMACGLPVIVTDRVGGSDDLIRDDMNGYVVAEKNVEQLYLAMRRILTDNVLHASMRHASQQHIENFSYDHAVAGYRAAIWSVCRS